MNDLLASLTARETEIAAQVATGNQNVEIAHALSISTYTVRRHVANIYRKLGLESRLELALVLCFYGVVDLERLCNDIEWKAARVRQANKQIY